MIYGIQRDETQAPAACRRREHCHFGESLALLGDNDYPYAVPISYVYHDGKLYFHSALAGHKVDAILKCDKASFCVIEKDDVQPEKYTTFFRSVIAFGRIHIIEDEGGTHDVDNIVGGYHEKLEAAQPECSATVTIRIRTMPCRKRLKAACLVCWPSALTSSI